MPRRIIPFISFRHASRRSWRFPGNSSGVSLTVRLLTASLLYLAGQANSARAQQGNGAAPPPDTTAGVDITAKVRAFTQGLDSVYTSISGTFYGIEPILKKSCYDCHSDQTHYPWYYKIPGIHGMIDNDIKQGRRHVDFSKGFPFGGRAPQEEHLSDMKNELQDETMPLKSYRFMHWGRLIEGSARDSVFLWIDSSLAAIAHVKAQFGIEAPVRGQDTVYVCPMDPDIISARAGVCPKCGMDLEPKEVKRRNK